MSDNKFRVRDMLVVSLFAVFAVSILVTAIFSMAYSKGTHHAEAQSYSEQYPDDTDQRIENCPTLTTAQLRECMEEALSDARNAEALEDNLAAQKDMAEWAFWLLAISTLGLIVTTIGTIFLAWQVRLSREAIKSSAAASAAMIKQNDIAEVVQRPWLQIEPDVAIIEHDRIRERLTLRCDFKVTNVGKMVAEGCAIRTCITLSNGEGSENFRVTQTRREAETAATRDSLSDSLPYPLLPGESTVFSSRSDIRGISKGVKRADESCSYIYYLAFIAARYHIPGEQSARSTDRSYCFTYVANGDDKIDPFAPMGIPLPVPDDLSVSSVWLRRSGHNMTT